MNRKPAQKMDPQADWAAVVSGLMKKLLLTQREIAENCQVAPSTVSAWKKGVRCPGRTAQRRLLLMAQSAGVLMPTLDAGVVEAWSFREGQGGMHRNAMDSPILRELVKVLSGATREIQAEVLTFARFRILHGKVARG